MKKEQIKKHKIAAKKLESIKNKTFGFIKRNIGKISEYEVNKFIFSKFKAEGLITQKEYPAQIISFDENTSFVHYYPDVNNSKKIKRDNLVLIDIWARQKEGKSPFADITWMGYTGKNIPKEILHAFKIVIGARDEVIKFIKSNLKKKRLPSSRDVETAARDYFKKFNLEKFFTHGVGHSLGISQDHGTYFIFSKKTKSKLKKNIPFTIEPGLYFKNKFGIRSEIDCYIDNEYRLVITTKIQRRIIKIL